MHLRNKVFTSTALVTIALLGVSGTPVMAQTAAGEAATGSAQEGVQIETVVVTAEHRKASAQKTAISMDVIAPEALAMAGVSTIQGLMTVAPGLSFAQSNGDPFLAIRGVSSSDVTEVGDPAVVVANDDFFLNRSYALTAGFYDVQRVEVLKGPQGTLYGRDAVAGVVNVISNKPEDTYSGMGSLTYGSYNTVNLEGMINVPLTDELAIRMSGLSQHHDGYADTTINYTQETQKANDEDSNSGRIMLSYEPGDHFSALITLQYLHNGGVGDAVENLPFVYDSNGYVSWTKQDYGDGRHFSVYSPSAHELTQKQARWQFSYDNLPLGATVTYLGGYDETQMHLVVDNTEFLSPSPPVAMHRNENPRTINQELRLTSPSTDRLTWQIGVYYFREDSTVYSYSENMAGASYGQYGVLFNEPEVSTQSIAGYGQASYNITDELKITGGVRYTSDLKKRIGTISLGNGALPGLFSAYNGDSASSKATYHAAIDWSPTEDNLFYVKFDTGYKAGGYNSEPSFPLFGGDGVGYQVPYYPETLKAYEMGTKNEFLDHTLQFNLSAYHYQYSNLQTTEFVNDQTGSATVNAKSAMINGGEIQVVALLEPLGRFDAEVDYVDSEFKNFVESPYMPMNPALFPNCTGSSGEQNCQLMGNMLPYAPKLTIAAGYQHIWDGFFGGSLTFDVHTHFQTKEYFEAFNFSAFEQTSYTNTNLNLTYDNDASHWEVGLYARNIENSTILSGAQPMTGGSQYSYAYAFQPPRTYGVKFTKHF